MRHFLSSTSLQQRLSLGLVALLMVFGIALMQLTVWLVDEGLRRYLSAEMEQESQTLLRALVRDQDDFVLDEKRLSASYSRPFSGHYFLVQLEESTLRSRSLWDHGLSAPPLTGLAPGLITGPNKEQLLVFRGDYRRFSQPIQIVVARNYSPVVNAFKKVQMVGAGIGIGALLLLVLLQRMLVKRALKPLRHVQGQIAQLQDGAREQLDVSSVEELTPLVDQINRLLTHTEDTLNRSRRALGNLGHALKTPLAVLISLSNRRELLAHPELHQQLHTQLAHMQERISRELTRARLAGDALPGAYFDSARELPDLCSTLVHIHGAHLAVNWTAEPGLRLPWDREDMLELIGNLLDNACKWASSRVDVSITRRADGAPHGDEFGHGPGYEICVEDDGPGISIDQRDALMARGARGDERVSGHGLGFSIVRDIVEHCRGDIALGDSALGGLKVSVRLPLNARQKEGL